MIEDAPRSTPFPGLRPFEADETHLFFGRDEQSDELLRRLRRSRFLAVVGTSGSGKSSLVRAGLLPSLFGGFMVDAGSVWRVATLRPGADPIGHLAAALNAPAVFGSGEDDEGTMASLFTEATLRRGPLGLVEAVRHGRLAADENLLVVVDQFEEIVRYAVAAGGHRDDDSAAFVKHLLEAVQQDELPIYVILTMRSDFLGDCARFRGLPEAINDGQYLIPRLTRSQLRDAITGPAAVGGAEVTPRLIQQLLGEVGEDPDQLPVLQHALMRTWDTWEAGGDRGPLDLPHYIATGGMAEALSRHADEAWEELGDERRREIARQLFQRLTEKGEDHREVRRPTRLGEICGVAAASEEEVAGVVDVFRRPGRSFLMPPAGSPLTAEATLDISHESLMRVWTRLRSWLDEEVESAGRYLRLAQSAALHAEGGSGLMGEPELAITLEWCDRQRPNAVWAERYDPELERALDFLKKSQAQQELKRQQEEEKRQLEIKKNFLMKFAALLAIVSVLAVGLAVWAVKERTQAKREAQEARSQTDRALQALSEAELDTAVAASASSPDGSLLASPDAAGEIIVREAQSGREVGRIQPRGEVSAVLFSPSGEYLAVAGGDAVRLWILAESRLGPSLSGHTGTVRDLSFSPNGRLLATGSDDGTCRVWNVRSGETVRVLKGYDSPVVYVGFDEAGTRLTAASRDGQVKQWWGDSNTFMEAGEGRTLVAREREIPARIYLHIRSGSDRRGAKSVAAMLEAAGFGVPGIEQLVDSGPDDSQLRYFKRSEEAEAGRIQALLEAKGVELQLRYVGGYEESDLIRPRHYEIWFAPGEPGSVPPRT